MTESDKIIIEKIEALITRLELQYNETRTQTHAGEYERNVHYIDSRSIHDKNEYTDQYINILEVELKEEEVAGKELKKRIAWLENKKESLLAEKIPVFYLIEESSRKAVGFFYRPNPGQLPFITKYTQAFIRPRAFLQRPDHTYLSVFLQDSDEEKNNFGVLPQVYCKETDGGDRDNPLHIFTTEKEE